MSYLPILEYNLNVKEFKILSDSFVATESGTGIVHLAPAFGEDDYRVCTKYKIINNQTILFQLTLMADTLSISQTTRDDLSLTVVQILLRY